MESQVSCHEVSNPILPENVIIKDVITSEVATNQPEKKQTRKWAAWTRQEQESFFNALRQFGKNFEKITYRVQSKNRDQVRHYYYRLVRRMNKLLDPELSLDAKNSKVTNAAMLRWWSLLEKNSCKASKIHLKPRRFKIFLETLEHQLLKDQKKNTRKQAFQQGEKEKNCNGDLSPVKQPKKRRKLGTTTSTTAYKKREKAAIVGVSLVADAAAHLEQTTLDNNISGLLSGDKTLHSVPPVQQRITKLKLQLFPINESLRKALEADNHNPHLELTLSFRKKISSVLEHINRKWGTSTIASGELTLLPYHGHNLNPTSCQKWTQDSVVITGDVYSAVGSPPIFRLRYGWFMAPQEEPHPPRGSHKTSSVFEWADSFTNISISDLLKDESVSINTNCNNTPTLPPGTQCPFSCDSFDAVDPTVDSSILDAEDACDAFTFFNKPLTSKEISKQDSPIEKVAESDDGSAKDLHMLTDIYWPDSLGPLEVDATPCRYQSNELILSESLGGGFSRILSNSFDSFQNYPFFGC